MKMHFLVTMVFGGIAIFSTSCQKERRSNNEKIGTVIYSNDGTIDGNTLTLGHLSDILDEGLTIQTAKNVFGEHPLVQDDGNFIELTYAVNSNNLYKNGMRITTIAIKFKDGVMNKASIGFTGFQGGR